MEARKECEEKKTDTKSAHLKRESKQPLPNSMASQHPHRELQTPHLRPSTAALIL